MRPLPLLTPLSCRFVELLCIKSEIPLANTDTAVEEVVKVKLSPGTRDPWHKGTPGTRDPWHKGPLAHGTPDKLAFRLAD